MRDDSGTDVRRIQLNSRTGTFIAGMILVALAWAIYRPDRIRPFFIVDFSEFIPLLQGGDGFPGRVRSVFEYYASQGRFNAIPYLVLSAKWELFSWWSPGWQVPRALLMVALMVLTFILLRRLGASRLGAIIGASVYLWAPSAADGWVHLTMAEPLGAAMMLLLAIRAVRFQAARRWEREVLWMASGVVALVWTKELMTPLILLPVSLALIVQLDGRFARPRWSPRDVRLVTFVAAALLIAFIPVVYVFSTAGESAYANMYGVDAQPLSRLIGFWVTGLAPFDLVVRPPDVLWAAALLGFATLISFGWPAGFRDAQHRPRARWLITLALVIPLAGVLAYLPNPWYARFYSLPYLFGPAILIGMGVTFLQATRPRGTLFALAVSAPFALQAALSASSLAVTTDAVQRRDDHLIAFVADSIDADSVYFATPNVPPYEWLGMGSSLSRMAGATGRPWPPLRYEACETVRKPGRSARTVTIDLDSLCKLRDEIPHEIVVSFRRIDPARLRVIMDTVHAAVIGPTSRRPVP